MTTTLLLCKQGFCFSIHLSPIVSHIPLFYISLLSHIYIYITKPDQNHFIFNLHFSQQQQQMTDQGQTQPSHHQEQEMELMFDKSLTPSDVGKLNRLVIPKQYAETYFPLSQSSEKGLSLRFEDEVGKQWNFGYSYWRSSQSYVFTKGWSAYVRDKQLSPGDVVSFRRNRLKLFISWRRRVTPDLVGASVSGVSYSAAAGYPCHNQHAHHSAVQPDLQDPPKKNKRQVRLFGVNLA